MICQKFICNGVNVVERFRGNVLLILQNKYPNYEVGLKCILMVFPYSLLSSYMNGNKMYAKNAHECYLA